VFDFRYHAISLVAVLVALVVGVLLGVAIGDAGLVSSAEQNLRADLREDVGRAQDRAADLESKLGEQQRRAERFESSAYPLLAGGRLDGRRVGLVFLGEPSRKVRDAVSDALDHTGGRLTGTLALREAPDLAALAEAAGDTRYAELERDPALLEDFGRRIGVQMIGGGKLLRSESGALLSNRAGSLGPFEAVVIARNPPKGLNDEERERTDALEHGLIDGLKTTTDAVAGVEPGDSTPSQVPWYRDRGISSVDNVDEVAGQAALIYALSGAGGRFGTGPLAEGLLPTLEGVSGE
jgi:hypothetical protein